jgi:hypothetical protein
MKNTSIFLFAFILLCACDTSDSDKPSLNGLWESSSYGRILNINDTIIKYYDCCTFNCLFDYEESLNDFNKKYDINIISPDSLVLKRGITEYGGFKALVQSNE